ncbi:MAG: hypothetical protein RIB65_10920 [Ilumatobacter fluminis]|uniref:hypothetical protein n=1 Tax=Ilumatobacter fluminis TaxID=467091 RepID=UPI0032ED27AA
MHHAPTLVRRAALLGSVALALTACGGSDDDASATTTEAAIETTAAPDTTAAPATTAAPTTAAPETTAAPATTAAPTTVPETTAAPDTTAPSTTAPAVDPDSSVPDGGDMALAQFCFDSQQVYVFNQVVSVLTEPTPEQAEAALSILRFMVDAAIASAPDGMSNEPQMMADALEQIAAGFAAYDYDVEAFSSSPEAEEIGAAFATYENVATDLTTFIEVQCGMRDRLDPLDSQAVKLAPIIDQLADLPLQPISNQAGDIRLFVPTEWSEWVGSLDFAETTVLQATTDIDEFERSWNVPGVLATVEFVGAGAADPSALLEAVSANGDCTLDATEPYADEVYVGELYLLSDCAGVGTDAAVLAATDVDSGSIEITLEFQFPDGGDRELLDQMLATFAARA